MGSDREGLTSFDWLIPSTVVWKSKVVLEERRVLFRVANKRKQYVIASGCTRERDCRDNWGVEEECVSTL